jgi:hypothetical protein
MNQEQLQANFDIIQEQLEQIFQDDRVELSDINEVEEALDSFAKKLGCYI